MLSFKQFVNETDLKKAKDWEEVHWSDEFGDSSTWVVTVRDCQFIDKILDLFKDEASVPDKLKDFISNVIGVEQKIITDVGIEDDPEVVSFIYDTDEFDADEALGNTKAILNILRPE